MFKSLQSTVTVLFFCIFSCESSSRNANVCQSVRQSVCQSVCHAYLFVRFTSIFYNSKSDKIKLNRILRISSHLIFRSTHVLQYLFLFKWNVADEKYFNPFSKTKLTKVFHFYCGTSQINWNLLLTFLISCQKQYCIFVHKLLFQ